MDNLRPLERGSTEKKTSECQKNAKVGLGLWPIAILFCTSNVALELRSLRSTIITRFIATTDLSATRRSPACSSRISGWDLSSRHGGLPMLTGFSFEHMSTPLPRRPDPVRMLLASKASFGLRPSSAGSTLTLTFSRPIRRSFIFQPVSSLDPRYGTFLRQRLRPLPLPAVTSPAASGWSNSYRVGYLPPTGVTRPFHGALRILVKKVWREVDPDSAAPRF